MMKLLTSQGSENFITVPVLSHTMNPQNKQKKQELGEFTFRESVFTFEDWTWVILELKKFYIPFYGSYAINFDSEELKNNPNRFSISVQSYHAARTWIQQTVDTIIQRELSGYANTVRFKSDGTPETEPTEELQIKAFELFAKARAEHVHRLVDKDKVKETTKPMSDRDVQRVKEMIDQKNQKKINVRRASSTNKPRTQPQTTNLPMVAVKGGEVPI